MPSCKNPTKQNIPEKRGKPKRSTEKERKRVSQTSIRRGTVWEEGRAGEWFLKAFKLSPLMHLLNKVSCSEKHIRGAKDCISVSRHTESHKCDKIIYDKILFHISFKTDRKESSLEKKTLRITKKWALIFQSLK